MSLGIFNRLFRLLENSCRQFDIELASIDGQIGGPTYQRYAAAQNQLILLSERLSREQEEATYLTQGATYLAITIPSPETSPAVQHTRQEASIAQRKASETVN